MTLPNGTALQYAPCPWHWDYPRTFTPDFSQSLQYELCMWHLEKCCLDIARRY